MEPDPLAGLPNAPAWGNALGTVGKGSVWLAVIAFSIAFLLCWRETPGFSRWRRVSFFIGAGAVVGAFSTLTSLFVFDQFQFDYIFKHSEKINPLNYKISSVWTAQQGSFLLWAFFSSILCAFTLRKTDLYERGFTAIASVFLGLLAAILVRETPFNIIPEVISKAGEIKMPPDGTGMVPSLQNYWNIIHPPTMFLGFGTLTVPFCFSIAAMLHRDHTSWVRLARGPVLFGMSALGLGISMGGLWAYETLGWGGFWAWDPVENVSLVPWLFLVALAHGLIVQTAGRGWKLANLLLGALPFLTFVYGTFLTRSGLLDKVSKHSFASMERGALQILRTGMIGFIALFVVCYIMAIRRTPKSEPVAKPSGVNRETFYQIGVLSLCLLAFVIALGMSWPVITALRGGEGQSVDEGVYHKAVVWFFIPIMIALAAGPIASWKSESVKNLFGRLVTITSLSIGLTGVALILFKHPTWGVGLIPDATVHSPFGKGELPLVPVMAFLMFLAFFPALTNLWRAIELGKKSKMGIGSFIAHFGIAMLMGGLIISRGFEREQTVKFSQSQPAEILGYTVKYKEYDHTRWTDRTNVARFDVTAPDGRKFEISPTLYHYQQGEEEKAQTWPYIITTLSHDIYFAIGPPLLEFFETPVSVKPGESKTESSVTIKYLRPTKSGQPGMMGAKFGGDLEISYDGKTYQVSPSMTVTKDGGQPDLTQAGEFAVVIMGMDAATKSLNIQLFVNPPVWQMQMFYKPLTSLVWGGTGIFTIGGLMSAFYRRSRNRKQVEGGRESAKLSAEEPDATVATSES